MEKEREVEIWNTAWVLVGGLAVCTSCMCGQSLLDAEYVFQHAESCPAHGMVSKGPWIQLHEILDASRG